MRNPANTLLTAIGCATAIFGVVAANMIVPPFEDVFHNFGAELPWLTRLFVHGGGFLWVAPLLVPVAAAFVRVRTENDKRRGIVALLLGVAIGIVLPMLCLFAMYLTIFQMGAAVDR